MHRNFIFISTLLVQFSFAEINIIEEIDSSWAKIKRLINNGDLRKFKTMYHRDAIMVNGIKNRTYSIRNAFDDWEQGFKDTRTGTIDAYLELKFSRRIFDSYTSHETGIFHYYTINESGESTDSFIHFEALWIKKQNKWFMLMENQISRASKSEWDNFKSVQ